MSGRISYYGNIVRDGLVLHLDAGKVDSYPRTGTLWRDLSGNNNNGTLINSPTFSSDNGGNIFFDGTNEVVTIPSISSLITNACSVSVWVKIPLSTSGTFCMILHNRNADDAISTFNIWFDDRSVIRNWNPSGVSNNRALIVSSGGGGVNYNTLWKTNMFTDNKFVNVTITTSQLSGVSMYVNGLLHNSISFSGTFQNPNVGVRLANYYSVNTSDYPLNGTISNTQIYNRILSASEVLQNYNALKGRYNL